MRSRRLLIGLPLLLLSTEVLLWRFDEAHRIPRSWTDLRLMPVLVRNSRSVLENAPQLTLYSLRPDDRITAEWQLPDQTPPDVCLLSSWDPNEAKLVAPAPLIPLQAKANFYGNTILGQIQVSGDGQAEALANLYKALVRGGAPMMCFEPHLGIRATQPGKTVDMVICFDCQQVHVMINGERHGSGTIASSGKPYFDSLFKAAKIPIG